MAKSDSTIGINVGTHAPSSVDTLGIPFVNDPEMSENSELCLLDSYWESPVRDYLSPAGISQAAAVGIFNSITQTPNVRR